MGASNYEEKKSLSSSPLGGGLLIIQSSGEYRRTHNLIDPFDKTNKEYFCPEMEGKYSSGCFENHLFLWDDNTRECFFLDMTSMSKIALPLMPIITIMFDNLCVSSSLSCPNCIVIHTSVKFLSLGPNSISENFIFFCRLNDRKWTKIPVVLANNDFFCGTNIVHQGKLYAQSSNGVVVFDISALIHGGNVEMKMIKAPEVSKYPKWDTRHLFMAESSGDIFMVRVYLRNMMVVCVDIYRLDISNTDNWRRVETINDRALFLEDNGSFSVRAKDVGVQSNCIYFACHGNLYKFCLDDKTFTFDVVAEAGRCPETFCWIIPSRYERIIESISELPSLVPNEMFAHILEDVQVETKANIYGSWADLPVDLFRLLLPCLSLVDVVRLRVVCKAWKSIPDPFTEVKTWPWLIYKAKVDGTYKFFDPLHRKQYTTRIERLSLDDQNDRILLICSKNGWIMALIDDRMVITVNPFFPDNIISSPALLDLYNFAGITFSSVPNCLDCVVFAIRRSWQRDFIEIWLWQPALMNTKWDKLIFAQTEFAPASVNPVFINGDFYCLGLWGKLGVFNLKNRTWKIIGKTEELNWMHEECYLLEYEGELICIFQNDLGSDATIRTFKWNHTKMTWDHMSNDLGELTIFLNYRSSLVKSLSQENNTNIFSSSFDPRILSNGRKTNNIASYNLERPIDCVWLEPNMHK